MADSKKEFIVGFRYGLVRKLTRAQYKEYLIKLLIAGPNNYVSVDIPTLLTIDITPHDLDQDEIRKRLLELDIEDTKYNPEAKDMDQIVTELAEDFSFMARNES